MGKTTTVQNLKDNKQYVVSTVYRHVKVPVKYGSIRQFYDETTEFESAIYLKKTLTGIFQKPVIMFHSLEGSTITLEELHDTITQFAREEDMTEPRESLLPFFNRTAFPILNEIFSLFLLSKITQVFIYDRVTIQEHIAIDRR